MSKNELRIEAAKRSDSMPYSDRLRWLSLNRSGEKANIVFENKTEFIKWLQKIKKFEKGE